jgi:hypothetical protein
MTQCHAHELGQTKRQEEELAEWILKMFVKHNPLSHQCCRLIAPEIQRASGSDAGLGREWL